MTRARKELALSLTALALIPVAVLIVAFQERVVGGLTQGGLKG